MKLGRLAGLERVEVEEERKEYVKLIDTLNTILADLHHELHLRLANLVEKYGDPRRTELAQIADTTKEEKEIEFVEPEKCVVVMTEGGLVKRVSASSFKVQKRNGKGVKTQDDITSCVIRTNTIDQLMVFTNKGQMYRLLVDSIPVGTNTSKGTPIKGLIEMEAEEEPTIIYSIYRDTDAKYIIFITKNGMVKKTALEEYTSTKKKTGISAINIKEGDELVSAMLIKDEDLIIATNSGYAIRFNSMEVGATSRTTCGVKGINLAEGDYVVDSAVYRDKKDQLAIFTKLGLGKKMDLTELPVQKRGGRGLKCNKEEGIVAITLIADEDNLLLVGNNTSICISATEVPVYGRAAAGNQMIKTMNLLSVSKV